MITKALTIILLLFTLNAQAQESKPVAVIDLVKIKNSKKEEAVFFYINNWKVYRDIALRKKYIISYKLLLNQPGSIPDYDIILITTYKDSTQYKNSEANFAGIIKAERPNGPQLLNEVKPADFRQNIATQVTNVIASD